MVKHLMVKRHEILFLDQYQNVDSSHLEEIVHSYFKSIDGSPNFVDD